MRYLEICCTKVAFGWKIAAPSRRSARGFCCFFACAKTTKTQKRTNWKSVLKWWAQVDSDHRSETQQIYSLPPLATRECAHLLSRELRELELVNGLEPLTCWLQISCSTNWATPAFSPQFLTTCILYHIKIRLSRGFWKKLFIGFCAEKWHKSACTDTLRNSTKWVLGKKFTLRSKNMFLMHLICQWRAFCLWKCSNAAFRRSFSCFAVLSICQ